MSDSIHCLNEPILIAIRAITAAIAACGLGDLLSLTPVNEVGPVRESRLRLFKFVGQAQLLATTGRQPFSGQAVLRFDDAIHRWVPSSVDFTTSGQEHRAGFTYMFDGDLNNLVLDAMDQTRMLSSWA